MTISTPKNGLLGDTPQRDYRRKLERFHRFAAPELRALIADLRLRAGERVLDAGCGAGLATTWLAEEVAPGGLVIGVDLAAAHIREAHRNAPSAGLLQADLLHLPLQPARFDLIWCVNAINHLHDPPAGVRALKALLRPGGRLVFGQSQFLPEMIFAWDLRLERVVTEACRQYYRDRYGLDEQDTTAIRGLVGLLGSAGFAHVWARTVALERLLPLDPATTEYIEAAIFRGYWGEHLRPYLSDTDWLALARLTDPNADEYCLRRPDFHYIQTFTLVGAM